MAIALVRQGTNAGTSASIAVSISSDAGDFLIATVKASTSRTVTSITDDAGNTWQQLVTAGPNSGISTDIWYSYQDVGIVTSVTVNLSGTSSSGQHVANVHEFSGIATSSATDGSTGATGNNPGTINTTNADDLLIASLGASGNGFSATTPASFTDLDSGNGGQHRTAYRIVSSTGTYGGTWGSGATSTATVLGAFKAAPTGTAHDLDLDDTITTSEATGKAPTSVQDASLTLSDALSRLAGKNVGDSVTLSDLRALAVVLSRSDSISLTDNFSYSSTGPNAFTKNLADTLGLSDSRQLQAAFARVFADSLGITDLATPNFGEHLVLGLVEGDPDTLTLTINERGPQNLRLRVPGEIAIKLS